MAKLFLGRHARKRVDRSPVLRPARWGLETAVMAGFWGFSALLSPDRASAAGRWALRQLGPRLQKTRHLRRNLALAFPDRGDAELDELLREVWGQVGALLAEYPHLGAICAQDGSDRVETVVRFDRERLRRRHKPAIFVTAHLANWEIAAAAGVLAGFPLSVVYTPIENPWIDRLLYRYRRALGCKLIARDDALRPLMRELAAGRSIGLLVDQRVDSGEPVPFFGIDKLTTLVPARLALRFGCDLIPVRVERLLGARIRVTGHEPVSPRRRGPERARAGAGDDPVGQRAARELDHGRAGAVVLLEPPLAEAGAAVRRRACATVARTRDRARMTRRPRADLRTGPVDRDRRCRRLKDLLGSAGRKAAGLPGWHESALLPGEN